jgi:galactokinase
LLSDLTSAFGAGGERYLAFAPGRVNLIGDHTDYADGFALPMTLDVGTYVVRAEAEKDDAGIRVVADRARHRRGTINSAKDRPP